MRVFNGVPIPSNAEELMDFVGTNFHKVTGAKMLPTDTSFGWSGVTNDTQITLSVHDMLSAFTYWIEACGAEDVGEWEE